MNNIIKMAVTLAFVGGLSGLLLSGLNLWTAPIMAANQEQQYQELLQQFFPEADNIREEEVKEPEGIESIDVVFDSNDEFLGLLVEKKTPGYAGPISYYLAIGKDGLIEGVDILGHSETPGIGCIITEPDFQEKIIDIDVRESFVVGEDVDIVSGATVTTEAFLKSVKEVAEVSAANYTDYFKGEAN